MARGVFSAHDATPLHHHFRVQGPPDTRAHLLHSSRLAGRQDGRHMYVVQSLVPLARLTRSK
jgi:hypothetical protein